MKIRAKWSVISLVLVICLAAASMTACTVGEDNPPKETETETTPKEEVNFNEKYTTPYEVYEELTNKGYSGSFEEWVESLKGSNGKSAYELAVENGYTGSVGEWLASLAGSVGADGKSAYDLAVENGYAGSLGEWLDSLVGEKGDDGITPHIGLDGNWWIGDSNTGVSATGDDGDDGMSPYIGGNGNWWVGEKDLGVSASSCAHNFGSTKVGLEPTCTSIGYNKSTCKLCGYEKYVFTEAKGHDFGDSHVVKKPSGGENGVQLTGCKVCGATKMEFIDGYSMGLSYEKTEREEYRVTGIGTCTDEDIIVPDVHEGLPVTEIGEKAFYGCDKIVSVTLPNTVTKVGDKAFSQCEKLENVSMSDKTEVGTDVFRGSINVDVSKKHDLVHVSPRAASCYEQGNIEYYWCESCDMYYSDSEGENRIYDVILPKTHSFVDGYCECGESQNDILIVSVDEVAFLGKFALGTLENAIGLPSVVNVCTADGNIHSLKVVWDLGGYNKSVAGVYTINGIIESGEYVYTDGLSKNISTTIEIVETMEGTADIVFILDISGSMGDEINNVKNNIQSFAQSIEDSGVSARWAAITYSDWTCSGYNEESMIIMNGASEWYSDASSFKNAIGSISLASGGDFEETAVDGLMLANTLSTRKDVRTFYILLTDATYKVDNNYGVGSMNEVAEKLANESIITSVIVDTNYSYNYSYLTSTTGGITCDIYGSFAQDLINKLVPIIYEDVIS